MTVVLFREPCPLIHPQWLTDNARVVHSLGLRRYLIQLLVERLHPSRVLCARRWNRPLELCCPSRQKWKQS